MINSLKLGSYIYSLLSDIDTKCKVYPLVADNDAKFPFIIYKRVGLFDSTTKDGYTNEDTLNYEIKVVTDTYQKGIDIANDVRRAIEHGDKTYSDMTIEDIRLINATEDYMENAFIQTLNFQLSARKN